MDCFYFPQFNVLTIDKYGIIQQDMTSNDFNDSERLLDRYQYFKKLEGEKKTVMLPKWWKKSFNNGIILPVRKKSCDENKFEKLCMTYINQGNENKKFQANL